MNAMISRPLALALTAAALTSPLLFSQAAYAKGGGGAVTNTGRCVGGGVFELKAKHDDGRIQVEYEVDTNRSGQAWQVVLTDNGVRVFAGTMTTTAPSGSFTVRRLIADRAGTDTIKAHATRGAMSCAGQVSS